MIKAFTVYTDCGHGWARIPLAIITELGIEDKISGYSYIRSTFAYLEEDCDMNVFHRAYFDKNGYEPKYITKHTEKNSKIRSYERFHVSRMNKGSMYV